MRRAGSPVRDLGLTACLGVLALGLAAPAGAQAVGEERPLPAPAPVADDELSDALATGELSEAEYALERARSLFQLGKVRREYGYVARPAARDATMILRDLALRVDDLTGAERAAAKSILARPTDGDVPAGHAYSVASRFMCGVTMCFHWVETTADAPDMTDTIPPNDIPVWVDDVRTTWEEEVWVDEIDRLGYRAPLDDSSSNQADGPTGADRGKLDVYILDLGADGLFGYCAPLVDELTTPVYCVVDNDYAEEQYGSTETPRAFLRVTSAHEFHHASQASYDYWEDYWFIEGTAANIEEDVYPWIDDNVNFLALWSPLTRPGSPLDRGGFFNSEYGAWIFWRFLQEKIAGGPGIIREIWERADAAVPNVSPDNYSLQAVTKELGQRGLSFRNVFAQFAAANRLGDYEDAQTAGYPIAPRAAAFGIGRQNPSVGWRTWRAHHLAARTVAFIRGSSGLARKLRVEVRLPKYGARATVLVVRKNGTVVVRRLSQGPKGYARWVAPFARSTVKRVEVVLSNGSTRVTSCWTFLSPPSTSCFGRPLDDNRAFSLRVRLVR